MKPYEKILALSSEYEATLMDEILNDKNIPHGIVSSSDTAMGGIWELENGWGYVEAPISYKKEIESIYREIQKK